EGALQSILTSVACWSAAACLAVGYSLNASSTQPLAEKWNGSSWTLLTPATLVGSADNELSAVACLSAADCVAVGRTYASSDSPAEPFAESWDKSAWSLMTTPAPTGVAGSFLSSVSCPTASTCEAAGESYLQTPGDSETLVERLAAGTWTIEASPNQPGVTTSLLGAVACPPASATCVAAGQFYRSEEDGLLGLARLSGRWTLTSVPGSRAPAASYLQAVACHGTTCAAVGDEYPTNPFNALGLVEQRIGTGWHLSHGAEPAGAVVTGLYGASCPATTTCYAVGDVGLGSAGQSGQTQTYAEVWNGKTWTAMSTPQPAGATYARLTGIACAGVSTCVATGYSEATPVAAPVAFLETLLKTTWTLHVLAKPSGVLSDVLSSVACPSKVTCVAVGSADRAGVTDTLAGTWNGKTWAVSAAPSVPGAADDELSGVACTTVGACDAVGASTIGNGSQHVLVERLHTGRWAVVGAPNVAGATDTVLTAVACPSATSCTASGYSVGAGGDTTLLEQTTGTTWLVVASGRIAGDFATGLNGIACSSASACVAAGSGPDGFGQDDALVEQS
ncbi:MAG: hypothetical protein ABSE47_10775, partial [Acidimicrobiales bacterium]